jgi:hypothetical protein
MSEVVILQHDSVLHVLFWGSVGPRQVSLNPDGLVVGTVRGEFRRWK